MRYSILCVLAGAAAVILLTFVGCSNPVESEDSTTGAPLSIYDIPVDGMTLQFVENPVQVDSLVMQDLDGGTLSLLDLRGKVTLVNYWATWCGPCRQEIPHLVELQNRYGKHLKIVGVSADEGSTSNVKAFAKEFGINYSVVMATPEINRQFPGVFALPTSFVLDTKGRIVQTHVGLINPAVLEQEIRYLALLPTNVTVELIENTQQTRLVDAAHATNIPGLDLSALTPKQKETALQRLNEDGCVCGCNLTLAQCRINDTSCGVSLPLAEKVIEEIVGAN